LSSLLMTSSHVRSQNGSLDADGRTVAGPERLGHRQQLREVLCVHGGGVIQSKKQSTNEEHRTATRALEADPMERDASDGVSLDVTTGPVASRTCWLGAGSLDQ
jgi:hypothetical protein